MSTLQTEKWKEEARKKAFRNGYQNYDGKKRNYSFHEEDLDTLITQIAQEATKAERERILREYEVLAGENPTMSYDTIFRKAISPTTS